MKYRVMIQTTPEPSDDWFDWEVEAESEEEARAKAQEEVDAAYPGRGYFATNHLGQML